MSVEAIGRFDEANALLVSLNRQSRGERHPRASWPQPPRTPARDEPDAHGVYPLHHTDNTRDAALVAALLAAGTNPAARSSSGWTGLHKAVAAGDRDVVRLVVGEINAKFAASYALKAARVAAALQQTCDFVTLVLWKLNSRMSLVGQFLPSDTTTVAKRWNAFRFDVKVVGISSFQPVCQRATLLFLGSKRLAYPR